MKPEQEAELTQGGDCFSHWHSEDRQPTQDFLHGLSGVKRQKFITSSYEATGSDDLILASGASTITLPPARNGREYTIVRIGTNPVTIVPTAPDTISGAASLVLGAQWASRALKAYANGWIIINGYL